MRNSRPAWGEPFLRALACSALDPGLRSILVFDASPGAIREIAAVWAQMLRRATNRSIVQLTLGSTVQDDDLWGNLALPKSGPRQALSWQPGLLMPPQDSALLHLISIPDLTQLSLAAARAFVMLAGAEVAHLERHGQHTQWQPRICWLAGCATEQVGKVSDHLLDRFTLRLKAPSPNTSDRLQELLSRLRNGAAQGHETPSLPTTLMEALERASGTWADVADEAVEEVLQFFSATSPASARRPIALTRLAVAHVRLLGESRVLPQHVQEAAQMIGLTAPSESKPIRPSEALDEGDFPIPAAHLEQEAVEVENVVEQDDQVPTTSETSLYKSDPPEPLPPTSLPVGFTPYPEDMAAIEHEATPLLLPFPSYHAPARDQGTVIGAERALVPHDLALVQTLMEAAKFQAVRKVNQQQITHNGLILSPADLRRYRRAPVPKRMLVLLLDYTSLRDCEWLQALLPYFRWSYVEHASLCLITVGGQSAPDELKAERFLATGVLTPQVNRAVETRAGRATPLAHGLRLAQQTLQNALQHGRSTIDEALLVVLSDGRGNVPLQSSLSGDLSLPVGRRGVEDALQVAQQIRELARVKTVVLNPQPEQYTFLPHDLARALGATIAAIPRLTDIELEGVHVG